MLRPLLKKGKLLKWGKIILGKTVVKKMPHKNHKN